MTHAPRTILHLTGADVGGFLQNLITNDVLSGDITYAALLTPQGKFLVDFFVVGSDDGVLLDVAAPHAAALAQRLGMYKLRADVAIAQSPLQVLVGTGPAPDGALPDPRLPDLVWRQYGDAAGHPADWDALRVAHLIPETGVELTADTYILEAGFERLGGVDFRKGCYVGQEVTARMKHKTELRKGLARVAVDGSAPVGTQITRDGKTVGTLYTQAGGHAIAYLRFDRAGDGMMAGDAGVTYEG